MPKRGNPKWAQGLGAAPDLPAPSDFERVAARLKLSPEEYVDFPAAPRVGRAELAAKVCTRNLLKAWGIRDWGPPDD